MKKKLLLVISVVAIGVIGFVLTNESETEKIKNTHAYFLKNHPYNKSLQLTKKERKAKGMPPNKYFEQEYLLEINPTTGRTHPENIFRIQKQLKTNRKLQRVPGDATNNKWIERGPNNVGGRTRVVMFDPNDATHKRVFAGGVSGGLWVNNDITDANSSWTRVGIDENLSISCMTVDPNNSQIMYVGTGESYTGDDAVGNGVWKSTDGGTTWTNVFSDTFNTDILQRLFYINDIIAWNNPSTNKTEVFIGVGGAYYGEGRQWAGYNKTGLYKSTNNGGSWTKLTINTTEGSPYEPNDLEIGANNTIWVGTEGNPWGHGGGTILKSTNGTSFTAAHTIANADRTEIAVSKTNKDVIYVLASRYRADMDPLIQKTTNSFSTATTIVGPKDADNGIPDGDFTRGQSFYDLVIEVDPTNDNFVYVGGIDLFLSFNSGSSWQQISKWSNNNNLSGLTIPLVHADQHGFAFHPTNSRKGIIGNDGGVYYASDLWLAANSTTVIEARNKDYNVTQFYHGEIGQNTSNDILLAGAQDNGTQFVQNASAGVNGTTDVFGGDGASSFVDKDGKYMIVSYVYSTHHKLNLPYNGSGVSIFSDSKPFNGSFINPGDLDDNLDILYTNYSETDPNTDKRTYKVARYTNLLGTPTKTELTNFNLAGEPTAFKVSPYTTTSTKLFIGTNNGLILKVENANTTPTWSFIGDVKLVGSVSSIEFGANENEILVTMHNYGVTSVWYTTDGGTNWVSKEGDLPDIPVKAIMMNPLNNDEVIIGTQLGVWRTGNFKASSPNWTQSYNGMSNVKVTSFSLRTADNTVMATTYGRGMFTGKFTAPSLSVNDVINDTKTFTMYPTVSKGNFTVYAKSSLGKAKLHLFDINGREVFSKQLNFAAQERQPVSVNLNAGVYIVNLIDANNKKSTGKIVIK
ncbi:MAG: T9SS type A sorting domain-containing protein [Flavobacteriaceae bacterium]|nr:T9SS type A sorting domain-containing protein [Flavobacteriaceae bacterium]